MACHLKETLYDCDAKILFQAAVYILRQDIPAARDVFSGDFHSLIRATDVMKPHISFYSLALVPLPTTLAVMSSAVKLKFLFARDIHCMRYFITPDH